MKLLVIVACLIGKNYIYALIFCYNNCTLYYIKLKKQLVNSWLYIYDIGIHMVCVAQIICVELVLHHVSLSYDFRFQQSFVRSQAVGKLKLSVRFTITETL